METDTFMDPIIWWFPHAVLYIFREGPTGYTWELVPEDSSGPSTQVLTVPPLRLPRPCNKLWRVSLQKR